MPVPNELRPTTQATVYSLLAQAGVDVSLWAQCKGGKKSAASNPKYCYEWAFIQPGKVVALNLWYEELQEHGGVISERRNLREVSPNITGHGEHVRRRRMEVFEKAVAVAVRDRLPVRAIICDGPRRDLSKPNSTASSAKRRMLDPEVWTISEYDKNTGKYVAVRGASPQAPLLDEEDFLQDLKRKLGFSMAESPPPYPEYPEHFAYIEDAQAREAFAFLVEQSRKLPAYTAAPHPHGYITRNLHYFDLDGHSSFAFNVAKRWLLFYLQRPSETHPGPSLTEIQSSFPDATHTKSGELNFRIRTLTEAKEAMRVVFGIANVLETHTFPDEVEDRLAHFEGARTTVTVNSFERHPRARKACIQHYGYRCMVCSFDFREVYGALGEDFIHVHHVVELASIRAEYEVDPIRDLRPVCPNCHAMLHRRSPPLSIEELQRNLTASSGLPAAAPELKQ